jgi:hypothetical protein
MMSTMNDYFQYIYDLIHGKVEKRHKITYNLTIQQTKIRKNYQFQKDGKSRRLNSSQKNTNQTVVFTIKLHTTIFEGPMCRNTERI